MKKIIFLALLVLLTGCGKTKIDNYTLYLEESELCDFNTIYETEEVFVGTYCVDSIKLKTTKEEEIDLKTALENGIIDIKDTLDGQIKETIEDDGSIVLKGRENYYHLIICDKSYSEKAQYVITPITNYQEFMCIN